MEVTKQSVRDAGSCSACTTDATKVYVVKALGTEYRLCKSCLRKLHALCMKVRIR